MKLKIIAMMAALFFSANALAASAYPDARTRNQRPASRQRGDIPLTPARFFASPREGRSEVCAQTQLRIILQTDLPASSQPDLISHSPFDNQE